MVEFGSRNKMAWTKSTAPGVSQCIACRHKFAGRDGCAAFPDAIPDQILLNEFDHHYPFQGDNGVQFEPIKEETT